MSEILSTDVVVCDILNEMTGVLSDMQLDLLKNTLYINLHDVQLCKQTYELATTIENNDTKKIEYFAVSKKLAKKSEKTIKQYVRSACALRNYVNKNFKDITTSDVKYYIAMNQRNGRWGDITSVNEYNYLNVFFDFLLDEGLIDKNPIRKIEKIKVTKKVKKPFSTTELEKMRTACSDDIRLLTMIEFFLSTALRVESVSILKWSDLDFKTKSGYVRVKGGNVEKFRYNEKTEYYLMKYLTYRMEKEHRTYEEMMDRPLFVAKKIDRVTKDYEAITTHGIGYIMHGISNKSGVRNIHPHRFRRTFACNALSHGMPLEEVQKHLMHKDIGTTTIYAEFTDEMKERSYRLHCE